MRDGNGTVIYVGKAVNLRSRVRSYFHTLSDHGIKTREFVRRIADIEWIIQDSELQALLLEYNLINRYQPKYNVRWKDDKRYPYIRVHWDDHFPKVTIARRMEADGSRYFGPYASAWAVHKTLDVLRKVFRYLTCDRVITGHDQRACLYWDINLCAAPCIGACTQDEYRSMMDNLCQFLDGKSQAVVQRLRAEMERAATDLKFERAATVRDHLTAIELIVEKQEVISVRQTNADAIAFDRQADNACVQVFLIRDGKLIGRDHFVLEGTSGEEDAAIITACLKHFYNKATYIPPEVLLQHEAAEHQIIEEWLRDRRGGRKVTLKVPKRGTKLNLVQMAASNATEALAALRAQQETEIRSQKIALAELHAALNLQMPPRRIECYDVSNTQGTYATGSMVVFHQGEPAKSHYRRFTIRTVSSADDCASLREVLTRRFRRWGGGGNLTSCNDMHGKKRDQSFTRLPDLLIVDGGKGQLGAATEVLAKFGIGDLVSAASLAKENEELFRPGHPVPIALSPRSQGLLLMQRIRDEAHRFALSHHRILRKRGSLVSQLDSVPGIGPTRRKALLRHFGSLNGIRAASFEDILKVRGMSRAVAKELKDTL